MKIVKKYSIIIAIIFLAFSILKANNLSQYDKHYKRGQVFLKNKLYKEAIKEFKEAIKFNPDSSKLYLKIGIIYDQFLHNYSEAILYYIEYIKRAKDPEQKEKIEKWIDNIANLKVVTTDKQFAKFKKAVKLYNDGVKLAKKRKFFKAIKKFKKSLKIAPFYAKAHYSLGLAYFTTKQYDKAFKHFLKAVQFSPDNKEIANAYYYLGFLYDDLFLKNYEMAYNFYRKYIEIGGDKSKQAEKLIAPIIKVNNLINDSINYARAGEFKKAENILKKALKIKNFDVRIYNNLAVVYIMEKKYDAAIKILRKALNIKEEVGDTYYNLACAYSKKKDLKNGMKYIKKGVKYFNKNLLKSALTDKDLEFLRKNDKDFKKIINSYLN